ncbi:MAG TPA: UDP-N-acetylmuramoyl-tripeptide--D-alanyl-D-alanine ligase [Phycisphaerales bacterium]|nr:UDP-N-acetylmuramoyl-tripeptide--D-alanyl-D-alanine ligase [Phycisphaerales bacterium]
MMELTAKDIERATGGVWMRAAREGERVMGVSTDTREDLRGKAFFAIVGERMDGHDYAQQAAEGGARVIVVERECELKGGDAGILKVHNTRGALGDLARAYRRMLKGLKVIGVTGSAGKTTTKRLIHGALSQELRGTASPKSFNNEIGVPMTLLGASEGDAYVVAEIGMNQPGEIGALARMAQADTVVLTMVGRAHLEGLGSVEAIAKEKWSAVEALKDGGTAVVNGDSELLRERARTVAGKRVVMFGVGEWNDVRLEGRCAVDEGQVIRVEAGGRTNEFELKMAGGHNAMNALAAIAVGRLMGLSESAIANGLRSVKPEAMRMAMQEIAGVHVYNDAYNANPESMKAGLATFVEMTEGRAGRRIVALGDMLELGAKSVEIHEEVGEFLAELCGRARIDEVAVVGALAGRIGSVVERACGVPVSRFADADKAAERVGEYVRKGDCMYLKASRGVKLERVLTTLEAQCSTT